MKQRQSRYEAKRAVVTFPCAAGTLHGAKPCFIFHAPQARFISTNKKAVKRQPKGRKRSANQCS